MKMTLVLALSLAVTAGAFAANRLSAQTTGTTESGVPPASTVVTQDPTAPTLTTPTTPPTSPTPTTNGTDIGVPTAGSTATVQDIVEITRLVPAGTAAVNAFTVPAGVTLIVTDLVITNTGAAATCGAAVNRTGTSTAGPTPATNGTPPTTGTTAPTGGVTVAGTVTQTDSTVTGPLCVPAQTTTTLPLTTGIEFAAGQSVQLMNTSEAAAPAGTTPGALSFHLRGLLVTLT